MVSKEGEAQLQNPDQEIRPKAPRQTRKKAQPVATEFPAITRMNEYGFVHFRKRWLEELGWTKGMELKLDRTPDGGLTLRKA